MNTNDELLETLENDIELRRVEAFEEPFYTNLVNQYLYFNQTKIQISSLLNPEESEKLHSLQTDYKRQGTLSLGLYKENELIGFSFGWQEKGDTFMMASSLIVPKYRRMGLYSRLLREVESICKEKGYIFIVSRHVAANNPILIAKMREDFLVSGFEVSVKHGLLIYLTKTLQNNVREAFIQRIG